MPQDLAYFLTCGSSVGNALESDLVAHYYSELRYAQVSKETYLYGKRGLLTFAYLRYAIISIGFFSQKSLVTYDRALLPYDRVSFAMHTHT